MPLRRNATKPGAAAPPFGKPAAATTAPDDTASAMDANDNARSNAMPATMKSHAPGGAKRRPAKFGKM